MNRIFAVQRLKNNFNDLKINAINISDEIAHSLDIINSLLK